MAGILTFSSLEQARRAGFEVYDRIPDGYLVRRRGPRGLELAVVLDAGLAAV